MKYLRERKLAKQALERCLGFAPKMEDIIPLESGENNGEITDLKFTIRGNEEHIYSTNGYIVDIFFYFACQTCLVHLCPKSNY